MPGIWLVRRPYQRLFDYTGTKALVPKCEIFDGSDFHDFYLKVLGRYFYDHTLKFLTHMLSMCISFPIFIMFILYTHGMRVKN